MKLLVFIGVALIFEGVAAAAGRTDPTPSPRTGRSKAASGVAQSGLLHQRTAIPLISAHRGASRLAPENTLAAFEKAMAMGCDFIEIDVRTTSDGVQVCLHDASLKRTTGLDSAVRDVSFKTVKRLSAGALFSPAFAKEQVPTLEEVCRLVADYNRTSGRNVGLYVDCKDIRAAGMVDLLTRYGLLEGAVFYGNMETLAKVKRTAPYARLMPPYPGRQRMAEVIDALDPFAFDVLWTQVDADLVSRCHRRGVKVFADLLDENDAVAQYDKAIRFGIDLIQTDDINSVKTCIEQYQKEETK